MLDVHACAACLATDMRMFNMRTGGLQQAYQLLSGRQLDERTPQQLCWECAALVNKFAVFRNKCERAYRQLFYVHVQYGEVTASHVCAIDRTRHNLTSPLNFSETKHVSAGGNLGSTEKGQKNPEPTEEAFVKIEEDHMKKDFNNLESEEEIDLQNTFLRFSGVECAAMKPDEEELMVKLLSSDDSDDDPVLSQVAKDKEKYRKGKSDNKPLLKDGRIESHKKGKFAEDFKVTEVVLTMEQAKEAYNVRMHSEKFAEHCHTCNMCSQRFRDESAYKKHIVRHDPANGKHECEVCRRRFLIVDGLREHMTKHMKQFMCNICGKASYTRESAKHHYRLHQKLGAEAQKPMAIKRIKHKAKLRISPKDMAVTEIILSQEQQMEAVRERQNARGYSTARFKCTLCYKAFNEQNTYSNHMRQHHLASGEHECDICKLRYSSRLKVYKHITNNHIRKYVCRLCPHVCYNRSFALNHYRWHKGVLYKCKTCGATFDKMTTHLSHVRIKHPSGHVCAECGEAFVSRTGLRQHANKMHSLKPAASDGGDGGDAATAPAGPRCAACDVQFTSAAAWTRHVLISPEHEHERHIVGNGCQYCGATFALRAELRRHRAAEHRRHKRTFKISADKLFPAKCAQCEEVMPSAGKYWQHFRQQHPGKQFPLTRSSFICEHCGNWFKYKSALEAHKRTHSERHRCAECPMQFAKSSSLAAHARCHGGGGGGAQFVCDVCSRRFMYKRSLTNHFRTHTIEKPHTCEWCGKTFAYDCNLKRHELAVHHSAPATDSLLV